MEEEIKVQNQVKETIDNQNLIEHLGEYGVKGGPGRPKGSKNKFTLIKEQLAEVWEEEGGKERFRGLFKGSQKDFVMALDKIISISPKEPLIKFDVSEPVQITYKWIEKDEKADS